MSFHPLKLMFYSFHFQPECFQSLSCFHEHLILVVPPFFSSALDSLLFLLSSYFTSSFFPSVSVLRSRDGISCYWRSVVTPRIRCARCLPVIHHRCHVICLRVAYCHVIMCISFCIHVRLMHSSIFPVVRFAIRHSHTRPLHPSVFFL